MISICVATYGAATWKDLAWSRAYQSTIGQEAEVIVVHLPDGTLAQARNEAARRATGKWLIFLDADDELAPGYVDAMAQALAGTALYVPRTSFVVGSRRRSPRFLGNGSLRDGNPLIIGTMLPRSLFLEVGGFTEDVPLFEDWMLFAQLWKAGAEIVQVPDAIYVAHMHRLSRNRVIRGGERIYWHQWIGHAVFPEHYAATDPAEDQRHRLVRDQIRFAS